MIILSNTFSSLWLPDRVSVAIIEVSPEFLGRELKKTNWESGVYKDFMAETYSQILGTKIPVNKQHWAVEIGDTLIVGMYKGPHWENGKTVLPKNGRIVWKVHMIQPFTFTDINGNYFPIEQ